MKKPTYCHRSYSLTFFFRQLIKVQSMMAKKTRERLYPEFLITKCLEEFPRPPCEPPKGKDIMERYFDVLRKQPGNVRSKNDAAYAVAMELRDLWERGDARIPLRCPQTLKTTILKFCDDLNQIRNKSKKDRPSYQAAVSSFLRLI